MKQLVVMLMMLFLASSSAFAREERPKPDFFTWLIGGSVNFNEGSLGHDVLVNLAEKLRQVFETSTDPDIIDPKNMRIVQGSDVCIKVHLETGREIIKAETKVFQDNGYEDGLTLLKVSDEPSFTYKLPPARQFIGRSRFRIYSKINGKDLDAVDNFSLTFESEESVYRRYGLQWPPAQAALPECEQVALPTPLQVNRRGGTVKVFVDGGSSCVYVFSDGVQVASAACPNGEVTFQNIPPGEVSVRIDNANQYFTESDPEYHLVSDSQGRAMPCKTLKSGARKSFKIRKKGGRQHG